MRDTERYLTGVAPLEVRSLPVVQYLNRTTSEVYDIYKWEKISAVKKQHVFKKSNGYVSRALMECGMGSEKYLSSS